jgi:hypothetical protein
LKGKTLDEKKRYQSTFLLSGAKKEFLEFRLLVTPTFLHNCTSTGLNHIVRRQKINDTKKSSFDPPNVPNDAECSYTLSE